MMTLTAQVPSISPTTVFYWTLLFIFLTGIITTIATKWSRDKCLKLFRGYRVTMERADGQTIWGVLKVFPTGVEVVYDHPYINIRGTRKTSSIVYQPELDTLLRTLLRYHDELTEQEQRLRKRQILRSFRPGPFRRLWRSLRNIINTLRDAFNAAVGAVVGQYQRANPTSTVAATQAGQVTQIGQTLLGRLANAYEPMLEQYIGHAVILNVLDPQNPAGPALEYAGYLADYSQQFIAIFNVEHSIEKSFSITLPGLKSVDANDVPANTTESDEASQGSVADHQVTVSAADGRLRLQNTGHLPLVARRLEREGFEPVELGATIPPKGVMELPQRDAGGGTIFLERVRGVDIVAPRKIAAIRHAGDRYEAKGLFDGLDLAQLPLIPRILTRDVKSFGSQKQEKP